MAPIYEFGKFRLDPAERLLLREGQPVALTPKAFDLLVYLVQHHHKLAEKQALMSALWPDTIVEETNLAYTVSALRKALADGRDDGKFIETVPTRGYRFVAAVTVSPRAPVAGGAPTPGVCLGPYHIITAIGAGAMGQVYKARDLRLDRTVAIKILSPELTEDAAAKQRFDREARAVAALSHPHICAVFDVGHQEGTDFLVMEFLDGETLGARLNRGKLPIGQALEYGIQIADGLAAAHKAGITHRDLKPGNIMLTRNGAKLLDFGLAKRGEQPVVAGSTTIATQPPISTVGLIVGTVPYMAPEQLDGKEADARADVYSFGAVLYEMITGKRAFEGSSQATLIANILNAEPTPLAFLVPVTPPALASLVRACLTKDPDKRWGSMHDVLLQLTWLRAQNQTTPPPAAIAPDTRWPLVVALLGVLALAAAGFWVISHDRTPTRDAPSVVRSLLDVRPAAELHGGGDSNYQAPGGSFTSVAWTPDGRALVFVGRNQDGQRLYLRKLDHDRAQAIAGTDGAQGPVISTDGRWVAFWADRAIRKVPLAGGPVQIVASRSLPPFGMAWSPDGYLFFADEESPIQQVSPVGSVTNLTRLGDSDRSHRLPSVLPGGQAVLYTVRRRTMTWGDEEIVAEVRATGNRKILLRDAVDARYLPSGHLLFLRRGTLFGVGFDPQRLEIRGTPIALLDGVAQALLASDGLDLTGAGQVAVSSTGTLAWVPGPVSTLPSGRLVTVDRHGHETPLDAPVRPYSPMLRVAPDGRRVAVTVYGLAECAIWVFDSTRANLTKLTPEGEAFWPTWSPDGRRVAFDWLVGGKWTLASQLVDGSAPPETLVGVSGLPTDSGHHTPSSWSADGRLLATVKGEKDIWIVTVTGATARPLIASKFREMWPEFSPDGRWLAYADDSSGRREVYVQPYPGPGPRMQVSTDGGSDPAWNPKGHELFFISVDGPRMMTVDVNEEPSSELRLGRPRPLFSLGDDVWINYCYPTRCYDVMPDGQRFIALRQTLDPVTAATHVHLVQNWGQELAAKVPSGLAR
jgi:serine/threonine-protein kinase